MLPAIGVFRDRVKCKVEPRHVPGRIKQWLHLLARNYPQAQHLFAAIRSLRTLADVEHVLALHGVPTAVVGHNPDILREAA